MVTRTGTSKRDVLNGTSAADVLSGLGGNDDLFGLGGKDKLDGGAGNDRLDGGTNADTMKGGAGNDTFIVDNKGDKVIDSSGVDTVKSSISFTLASTIENLTLTGARAINGFGSSRANILIGNAAANILDGKGGADVMRGGAGNDIYIVDNAGDTVSDSSGIDIVKSSVSFTLSGGVENLTLTGTGPINGTGNGEANTITGNGAANVLDGGAGADVLIGGGGDDVLRPGNDAVGDVINGGLGRDTVDYSGNTSAVKVSLFDNVSGGSATGDTWSGVEDVIGTGFADDLRGANGGSAFGGAGNDHLRGSAEAGSTASGGVLRGDEGFDTLHMENGATLAWLQNNSGADAILNFFEGEDKFFIDLSDWGFGTTLDFNELRNVTAAEPPSGSAQFTILVSFFHLSIGYDADGDGSDIPIAGLDFPGLDSEGGQPMLELNDFVWIV